MKVWWTKDHALIYHPVSEREERKVLHFLQDIEHHCRPPTTTTTTSVWYYIRGYCTLYCSLYWIDRTPWGLPYTDSLLNDILTGLGKLHWVDIWWYLMISTVRYGRLDVLTLRSLSVLDNIIFCQGELLSTTVIVKDMKDWFFYCDWHWLTLSLDFVLL